MTSVEVNEADSRATLNAAYDAGVNFFDTAYCYGADGISERLIGEVFHDRRDEIVIATKCGVHWDTELNRQIDGRPETIHRECDESLRRLGTDHIELLYLHAPDPSVPIVESAGALKDLMDQGKTRCIGASNFSFEQLESFHAVCPLAAFQPPYNMLQRQIEADTLPWCRERGISVMVYWPLMKGLLAGKIARDHVFLPNDGRAKYPMFQGEEFQRNQDFLDQLRRIADETGKSVSQVVVNWTFHQPGITVALCGAKRAYQIEESAGAMGWTLSNEHVKKIEQALADRGVPIVRAAV